jgi:threonine aldolase
MYLFVDGARIANALVSLNVPIAEMLEEAGVDAFTFGGTKNGLILGEAVVIFREELARNFGYRRKQGMQLASKMRFLSCQFEALLSDDLWLKNAGHANRMARLLEREMRWLPGVEIVQPVQANGVFAKIPKAVISTLQEKSFFYVWNEARDEVRWLCSWDTTEEDIRGFVVEARRLLS